MITDNNIKTKNLKEGRNIDGWSVLPSLVADTSDAKRMTCEPLQPAYAKKIALKLENSEYIKQKD